MKTHIEYSKNLKKETNHLKLTSYFRTRYDFCQNTFKILQNDSTVSTMNLPRSSAMIF